MPWSPNEAIKHKKGLSPQSQRKWASVANQILKETNDEGKAIRVANGVTQGSIVRRLQKKRGVHVG